MEIILNNESGELARGKVTVSDNSNDSTGAITVKVSGKLPGIIRGVVRGLKSLDDKQF